tara:strand:+ start:99 stop:215 length:117 start_codon:yes stop_codon:yes gene_type:complete
MAAGAPAAESALASLRRLRYKTSMTIKTNNIANWWWAR